MTTKWEYLERRHDQDGLRTHLLDADGDRGWEAVAVYPIAYTVEGQLNHSRLCVLLKRPKRQGRHNKPEAAPGETPPDPDEAISEPEAP